MLADRALYDQVNRVQAQAIKVLCVHATPTLFLNGVGHEGASPAEAFDGIVRK